jgi:hypothetical protein
MRKSRYESFTGIIEPKLHAHHNGRLVVACKVPIFHFIIGFFSYCMVKQYYKNNLKKPDKPFMKLITKVLRILRLY